MEAATAVAVIAAAPLTISGYAHIKDCFKVSAKRVSETPALFKDAFNTPAKQLKLEDVNHKLRGHVTLFVDGREAGRYLEFNGEVLLVGDEPTGLKPVASVGGATVRSHPLSIQMETWEAPRELSMRFGSEHDAQLWAKALSEAAAKLPHHPARLDSLVKHIYMQDMHNKDLQFRMEHAMEACKKAESQLDEVSNEKMVRQLEEKLREAHAHIQHLKARCVRHSQRASAAALEAHNQETLHGTPHGTPHGPSHGLELHVEQACERENGELEQTATRAAGVPAELPREMENRELEQAAARALVTGERHPGFAVPAPLTLAALASAERQPYSAAPGTPTLPAVAKLAEKRELEPILTSARSRSHDSSRQGLEPILTSARSRSHDSSRRGDSRQGSKEVHFLQLPSRGGVEQEMPHAISPRSADVEVLQMLEATEARRRELEERCLTLEQRLKQVVEFESEPQAAQLQELAALCERQQVELDQLRGEDGAVEGALTRQVEFVDAAQPQAAEQLELNEQDPQAEARSAEELSQPNVEVLMSRVTEAEAEVARLRLAAEQNVTTPEAAGRHDVRALKMRVTEAEAEASQLREAAHQLERQVVELEQLHAQVSVGRQVDAAEVENMQEPSLQSEQHAVELEQLRAEVLMARQAVESAETEKKVLKEELAHFEAGVHRAAEAEARAEQLRSVLEAREMQLEVLKQEIEQLREESTHMEALLHRATDAEARAEQFRIALESEQETGRLRDAEADSEEASGTARQAELEVQRVVDAEAKAEQFRTALEEREVQLQNFKIALGESEQENVRLREAFESYEASDAARQAELEFQRLLEEKELQLESFRAALAESDQDVQRLRSAAAEGFEATEAARQAAVEESTRVEELLQRTADAEAAAEQLRIALQGREQQIESFKASFTESDQQLAHFRALATESAEANEVAKQSAFEEATRAEKLLQRASDAEGQLEQLRATVEERGQELERFREGSEQELAQFRAAALESAEASEVAKQVALQESARADTLQQRTKEAEARAEQLRSALAESDEQLERFKTVLAQSDQELARLRTAASSSAEACEAAKQAHQQERTRSETLLQHATGAEARSEQFRTALEEKELQLQRLRSAATETEEELSRHREAGHAARQAASQAELHQQRAVDAEVKVSTLETVVNDQIERIRHLEVACGEQIRELNELRSAAKERADLDKMGKQTLLQEAKAAEEMANAHLAMERRMADEAIQQRAAAEQELARLRLTLVEKETAIVQLRQETRNAKSTAQAQAATVAEDAAQLRSLLEHRDAQIERLQAVGPRADAEKAELQRELARVQAREAHLSTLLEEQSSMQRQMAEQFEAEQRKQTEQAERELYAAFQQHDVLKARMEEAEGKLASEGPRRAEQELAQRLAASEQDVKGAKVRLSAAEQELLVAHQTIERQRQEYEALRSETAHAFKVLQDERSGHPQQPGEGSPEGGRLAAQLALVQQEKLALQEELAQRTVAYNRELDEVGRKMNSMEAALLAVGGIPKANTPIDCASARSLTTQPALDNAARGASGESQPAGPPVSRLVEPVAYQNGTCPGVAIQHQVDGAPRQILSPVQIASPTQVTSPSSVQGAPMMFAKQQAPPARSNYSASIPSTATGAALSPNLGCGAPPNALKSPSPLVPVFGGGFARPVQGPSGAVSPLRLRSQEQRPESIYVPVSATNVVARPPSPAPFRAEPSGPQAPAPFGKRSAQELPRAPRTFGAQLAPPGAGTLHAPPSWTHASEAEKLRMAESLHFSRSPIASSTGSGISGVLSGGGMASFTPAPIAEGNVNLRRLSFDRTASTEVPKSPLTATRVSNR